MTDNLPTLSGKQLRELLDCSNDDLRNWRRLPLANPRHLPAVRNDEGHYEYPLPIVVEWLRRPTQSRLLDTVMASFAPPAVRAGLLGSHHDFAYPTDHQSTVLHTEAVDSEGGEL